MSDSPFVLVTGTSSGFGLLTAQTLARRGATVFATMRDPAGRNADAAKALEDAAAGARGALHVLHLDVTDDASVAGAVAQALAAGGRLDAVVNNAGIGAGGIAEAFTAEQYAEVFDVNVLGAQRVNRAVLPAMREAGRGLVVFVSSVMGRTVIPFAAPYTVSKWALEGLAECYREELARTGVEVAIVEPGGFMTGFAERMVQPEDQGRVESYGDLASMPETVWAGVLEALQADDGPDPQAVADAIVQLVGMPDGQRPLRTVVDPLTGGEGPRRLNELSAEVQRGMLEAMGLGEA